MKRSIYVHIVGLGNVLDTHGPCYTYHSLAIYQPIKCSLYTNLDAPTLGSIRRSPTSKYSRLDLNAWVVTRPGDGGQ